MIQVDTAELTIAGRRIRLIGSAVPRVFASALNRTAQGVKTEAVKKVREMYSVKATDIRPLVRLSHRASAKELRAEVTSSGRNIPLIKFKTTPGKPPAKQPKSVRSAVLKGNAKVVKGGFVTQVGSHVGVFKRAGRRRLPIQQLYGPAMPVMLNRPEVITHLQKEAAQRLNQRLDHEIKRVMERSSKA
ncbi:phage tail protein [Paenibacillus sp. TAB 01]|uniref:phage tail protein n=1 Tax=Paenibacillus sp. TAB 01 TaxID=3368988 RepID=UPI003753A4E6